MSGRPECACARNNLTQQVSYIACKFDHTKGTASTYLGAIPPGSIVLSIKAFVTTIFPDAKISIGDGTTEKQFGEKDVKTKGPQNYQLSTNKMFAPEDKNLKFYAKLDKKVASGECLIVIQFITDK